MWEMANSREHCSWVHSDKDKATKKALSLIIGAINKVKHHGSIETKEVHLNRDVLVIGAGNSWHTCFSRADDYIYLFNRFLGLKLFLAHLLNYLATSRFFVATQVKD